MMTETPDVLHISGFGKKLKKHNDLLIVEWEEGGDKQTLSFTPSSLEQVILSGDHAVTTGAMRLLFENNVSFSCLDKYGRPVGYLFSHTECRHVDIWKSQLSVDHGHSLDIAKSICMASAQNKVSLLRSLQRSRNMDFEQICIDILEFSRNMIYTGDVSELMGYEGNCARLYFGAFRQLVPDEFGFGGRTNKNSLDPVNVLLNYGYGILYSRARTALIEASLNPHYGVMHASYRGQEPLVYDLVEEFRQHVVDRTVITLLGRKQVNRDDFTINEGSCSIKDDFKKEYAGQVLDRMGFETEYYDQNVSFKDIITRQARKIRDAIVEGHAYEPFIYRGR